MIPDRVRERLAAWLDDPDPIKRRHAATRLAALADPPAPTSTPAASLAANLRLMRLAATCPYRTASRSCGCNTCGLTGARKTPRECWACVDAYGVGLT